MQQGGGILKFEILDKPLLKLLLDKTLSFNEVMNACNIRTSIAFDLESSILGFVYLSRRGRYHLILNGNVNYETQCKTFVHEIKHIAEDMPKIGYIIGLDSQYSFLESEADVLAEMVIKDY